MDGDGWLQLHKASGDPQPPSTPACTTGAALLDMPVWLVCEHAVPERAMVTNRIGTGNLFVLEPALSCLVGQPPRRRDRLSDEAPASCRARAVYRSTGG